MKKMHIWTLILMAFLSVAAVDRCFQAPTAVCAAYKINKEVAACTVKIDTSNGGGGSGIVVRMTDTVAQIVTAKHVVGTYKSVKVSYIDGMSGEVITALGKVVKVDPKADLALVETMPVWGSAASVITKKQYQRELTIYQQCLISGYPVEVHTTHITSGMLCDFNEGGLMRQSANAIYGNSGGGVFVQIDGKWRLVGVLVQVWLLDGQRVHPLPHITFSVGPVALLEFLGD